MAQPGVVVVHVEWIGHQIDLWCLDCGLTTRARAWYTTTAHGETRAHETRFCTACGGKRIEDAEPDIEPSE